MRVIRTHYPSFPEVLMNHPIIPTDGIRWQVLCGDRGHYRIGLYSPEYSSLSEIKELEQHDCPEFFLLLRGHLTLVLATADTITELPLEMGKPVFVSIPHNGYCPGGPFTGIALVVERDEFRTEYRPIKELLNPDKKDNER